MSIAAARELHFNTFFIQVLKLELEKIKPFGSGQEGRHDGNQGVQWNAWVGQRDDGPVIGCVGVNLEGITYDNWPIDRLIERELARFSLFRMKPDIERPEEITVRWTRDVWANRRRRLELQRILLVRLSDLSEDEWRRALIVAQGCINREEEHRRRARKVTTVNGVTKEREVSPHLQLYCDLWRNQPPPHNDLEERMRYAYSQLDPLYRKIADLSKKI